MSTIWNPWHGCKKLSEGCKYCYVYRRDESIGKDASIVVKTKSFDEPLKTYRDGRYKIPSGETVYTCMTSDFFLDEADAWRTQAWEIIKKRSDLNFYIITKRISRFIQCIPEDWGSGYSNVTICCTIENQRQCDIRLPIFLKIPAHKKHIICEPLLSQINFGDQLDKDEISMVIAGGESGKNARTCRYSWILNIRDQCFNAGISFHFKQTGKNFFKDGKRYNIPRNEQISQAKKSGISFNI